MTCFVLYLVIALWIDVDYQLKIGINSRLYCGNQCDKKGIHAFLEKLIEDYFHGQWLVLLLQLQQHWLEDSSRLPDSLLLAFISSTAYIMH
ncbi:hypothetical protein VNO77_12608 [Canavalia gladiata]|uniref:Uncharacterized protein n=1 Tax=Canavalia gladiata TaxID=3824 RepID=A0AAN9LWH0_CANGL